MPRPSMPPRPRRLGPISPASAHGGLLGGMLASNVYDSGRTLGTAVVSMLFGGSISFVMNVTIHHVWITGTLSGTRGYRGSRLTPPPPM